MKRLLAIVAATSALLIVPVATADWRYAGWPRRLQHARR